MFWACPMGSQRIMSASSQQSVWSMQPTSSAFSMAYKSCLMTITSSLASPLDNSMLSGISFITTLYHNGRGPVKPLALNIPMQCDNKLCRKELTEATSYSVWIDEGRGERKGHFCDIDCLIEWWDGNGNLAEIEMDEATC